MILSSDFSDEEEAQPGPSKGEASVLQVSFDLSQSEDPDDDFELSDTQFSDA